VQHEEEPDPQTFDVYVGLDVGKSDHHAVALSAVGKKLYDKALPNDEAKLRAVLDRLDRHGRILLVVDQPATIGALPVAVARDAGVEVAYLPGLAMRRIADLHPGEAKTDARDAAIIAEAARTMPHTLRAVNLVDEQAAELAMLCGFDEDLCGQITATSNRISGLYTQIHPALERVLCAHLDHPAVLDLIEAYPTPDKLRRAGKARVQAKLKKKAPRAFRRWAESIFQALDAQSVTVVGTNAAGTVLPHLASQLRSLRAQREDVAAQVEHLVEAHPLYVILTSMPGIGVRTAAWFIAETAGKHFPSAAHLAAYAGLAPVTRRSGSSIRGEHPSKRGNKRLKRALFLSAFAALRDPTSRTYYDRKVAQGKRHNQALIALARRRCDVLYAMIKNGALYDPPQPKPLPLAA
jgi:transposase